MSDGTFQKADDGSWQPAQPMGWQGTGIDFEVRTQRWDREKRQMVTQRPFTWEAFYEDMLVGKGKARTKVGLFFALWRCRRRFR